MPSVKLSQVGREPVPGLGVGGAQPAVVGLGAGYDVLDVGLLDAVEPGPGVGTVYAALGRRRSWVRPKASSGSHRRRSPSTGFPGATASPRHIFAGCVGAGVGVGSGVGTAVAVGVGCGVGTAVAAGVGVSVGAAVGAATGVAGLVDVGISVAVGSGSGVGFGAAVAVGSGAVVGGSVGLSDGSSVGAVAWVGSGWVFAGVAAAGCGVGDGSTTAVGTGSTQAIRVSTIRKMAGRSNFAMLGLLHWCWCPTWHFTA